MTTTPAETDTRRAALKAELATLQAKARARRDQPGFNRNVAAIDARCAEIEAELSEIP